MNGLKELKMELYGNIKTKKEYDLLLESGMFWGVYPELTGEWGKDKIIIKPKDIKKYDIIYADPAWEYNSRMALGKGAKRSSVEDYYDSMNLDDIKNLPIKNMSSDNSILFMWVTMPKLNIAFDVIKAWGFSYKTCGFVWVKRNKLFNEERNEKRGGIDDFMGQGRWVRQNAELCLLATKGKPKRLSAKVRQIIYTPIEAHSKKPNRVKSDIIDLCGDLPKIELFSRSNTDGWDAWGNEVENSIDLSEYYT